jgi:peptidoglycan/LPS O-acetylase OafA/YrhL
MSLLFDLVSDLLAGALGPVSNKGLLLVSTVVGLALAVATGWLAVNSPIDVNAPDWRIGVVVCSLAIGSSGAFLAVLHLLREPQRRDRVLAAICLVVNLAAALLAVASFLPIGGEIGEGAPPPDRGLDPSAAVRHSR